MVNDVDRFEISLSWRVSDRTVRRWAATSVCPEPLPYDVLPVYTIKETADLLGISERTVKRRVADMSYLVYRVGRTVRIPRSEFAHEIGG